MATEYCKCSTITGITTYHAGIATVGASKAVSPL